MEDRSVLAEITRLLIHRRHYILAYLYSLLHDHHAVEDVFQDVSLIAIQKAEEYRPGSNFIAWVFAISRNKVREHLRKRMGAPIEDLLLRQMEEAFAGAVVNPDLERRKRALRQCVASLQQEARRVLELRYQEGLSPADIAAQIRQTRTAVNSVLQRIREKLRACVEQRLLLTEN
jgi:RNA polymerase sigma-70 factor (ECF subfamily)